jgi:uncharacterized protein YkwD
VENKNQIPQTIFSIILTTAKTAVLVLLVLFTVSSPRQALAGNALLGQESAIITQTNAIRAEAGLPALTFEARLARSAAAKANDMATKGYFDHGNPDGYRMSYWINNTGYTYTLAGENLAKGFSSVTRLMNAWVASPSHYKNLVEPQFTDIGIGMAEGWYDGQSTLFVVQHFGAEAAPLIKDVSQFVSGVTAMVAPLVETVAGTTEGQTIVNNSTPLVSPTVVKPVQTSIANSAITNSSPTLHFLPSISLLPQPAQAGTVTPWVNSTDQAPICPNMAWAILVMLIVAILAYFVDFKLIVLIRDRLAKIASKTISTQPK